MTNESCSAASDNAFLMLAQYTLIALGLLLICLKSKGILHQLDLWLEFFLTSVPAISVELELSNDEKDAPKGSQTLVDKKQPHILNCYNPSSGCCLALSIPVPNMSEKDVDQVCQAAHTAQKTWSETTFAQRRLVLRVIQKWLVNHSKEICQLCAIDSGKTHLDALLGEVLTTCEKTRTLLSEGELWLQKSYRSTGPLMMHKGEINISKTNHMTLLKF